MTENVTQCCESNGDNAYDAKRRAKWKWIKVSNKWWYSSAGIELHCKNNIKFRWISELTWLIPRTRKHFGLISWIKLNYSITIVLTINARRAHSVRNVKCGDSSSPAILHVKEYFFYSQHFDAKPANYYYIVFYDDERIKRKEQISDRWIYCACYDDSSNTADEQTHEKCGK